MLSEKKTRAELEEVNYLNHLIILNHYFNAFLILLGSFTDEEACRGQEGGQEETGRRGGLEEDQAPRGAVLTIAEAGKKRI